MPYVAHNTTKCSLNTGFGSENSVNGGRNKVHQKRIKMGNRGRFISKECHKTRILTEMRDHWGSEEKYGTDDTDHLV